MTAYYNEIDPNAASWLRELIRCGHIAPGVVDTRSIEDVTPQDLAPYTQCHFFAGIGVWSYALRSAGWPDDRRVWTGSCPCQPFSAAGKGNGFDDERHLWPAWFHLIAQCRPERVYGEQVASSDGLAWFDLVHADLEEAGYACGAVDLCAAGVGAPHIRQRLWFVADAEDIGPERCRSARERWAGFENDGRTHMGPVVDALGARLALGVGQPGVPGGTSGANEGQATERAGVHAGGLADDGSVRLVGGERPGATAAAAGDVGREAWEQRVRDELVAGGGDAGGLADDDAGLGGLAGLRLRGSAFHDADGRGPCRGHWADADWIACRDDKWRPVEPGTFPLAHGAPARVGRLRGYGNAIVAQAAIEVIRATF